MRTQNNSGKLPRGRCSSMIGHAQCDIRKWEEKTIGGDKTITTLILPCNIRLSMDSLPLLILNKIITTQQIPELRIF